MKYARRAMRDLASLDVRVREHIERDVASQLGADKRCHAKKLRTSQNCHILLVGPAHNYRVIVSFPAAEVLRVGDRKDIYRRLIPRTTMGG